MPDSRTPVPPRRRNRRPPTLERELLAVLFLYAALSILPILFGMMFAPS